tara:strand:+ start:223 stop:600 length:378 start_codon:yes stop_codon:yes gene_type:complete
MAEIYRCRVSDGTVHYFDNKVEAEFFAKDSTEAGFAVHTHPIPLPRTAKDFRAFMEREEEENRHAETTLAAIQNLTPCWRAFRDLPEAVNVAIHNSNPHAFDDLAKIESAMEGLTRALGYIHPKS